MSGLAPTDGWDTVFGIRLSEVNAALTNSAAYPKAFQVDDPTDGIMAQGVFGSWQIAPGGSNQLVNFVIPVPQASVTLPDKTEEHLQDVTVPILLRMEFIPSNQSFPSGTGHDLVIWNGKESKDPAVQVGQISYGGHEQPSFVAQAAFLELIGAWLNANISDFSHVFATVNLNRKADKEYQWMQPTSTAYAYSDVGYQAEGVLAILNMTEGRSSSGLQQQISSSILEKEQQAAFLISSARLIEKFILPTLPKVFPGSKVDDFEISKDGLSIHNKSSVPYKVKDKKNNTSHDVTLETLQVTMGGTFLRFEAVTCAPIIPGIKAMCHTINALSIKLAQKADGKPGEQTFTFEDAEPPLTNHWLDKDPAIAVTEEILTIVAIIVTLIIIFVTDGAAILIVAGIIGVVLGTMMITEGVVGLVDKDNGPAIGKAVLNATAPICWKDADDFKVTKGSLNGSLQLIGISNVSVSD